MFELSNDQSMKRLYGTKLLLLGCKSVASQLCQIASLFYFNKIIDLYFCVTLIITLIVEFLLLGLSEICWKKLVLWSWNWYILSVSTWLARLIPFFYRYPVEILLKRMGRRHQIRTDSPLWQLTGPKKFLVVPLVRP